MYLCNSVCHKKQVVSFLLLIRHYILCSESKHSSYPYLAQMQHYKGSDISAFFSNHFQQNSSSYTTLPEGSGFLQLIPTKTETNALLEALALETTYYQS